MLYREIIAVCSEIHTKHINTAVWAERRIVNVKLVAHIVTTGTYTVGVILNIVIKRKEISGCVCVCPTIIQAMTASFPILSNILFES